MLPEHITPLFWTGTLVVVAVAELLRPGRAANASLRRWGGNIALYLLSNALFLLPLLAALLAARGTAGGGLLSFFALPAALHAVLAVLALDAANYAEHRLSHAIAPLWRLHAVHHSDADPDVTTTIRHHPLEMLVSALASYAVVTALGAETGEVLAYAALSWVVQAIAHANLALPPRPQAVLARLLVTPGFHLLHHSRHQPETDSNYGSVFTLWDRLFGTFAARHPAAPPIVFGLDQFADPRFQDPHWLLAQPFLSQKPASSAAPPGPDRTASSGTSH